MFELWFFLKFLVISIFKRLTKRLTIPAFAVIALSTALLVACQPQEVAESPDTTATPVVTQTSVTSNKPVAYPDRGLSANPAQLPQLPYAASALEKAIDAQTMTLHHGKHHQTYVDNLNKALEQQPNLRSSSVEAMVPDLIFGL